MQTTTSADEQATAMNEASRKVPRWVHRVAVLLVVAACAAALYFSGWGMWHFIEHKLGVKGWHLILPMFLLFDLAGIASAWLARIRRIEDGKSGVAGLLVWVFAVLSGLMSATDAETWGGHAIRFAAPLVAAVMFELLISGERRAVVGKDNSTLAKIVRRIKSRLGLLDTLEQDDQEAARAAVAGRVAVLAYKVQSFPEKAKNSRAYKRAVRKYHRRLRSATERFGFGGDAAMVNAVRLHLATLYRSLTDTTEAAVADINPWQSAVRNGDEQPDIDAEVEHRLLQLREEHTAVAQSLRAELADRDRRLADLEPQLAAARSADDVGAELAAVRDQLERLAREREQAQASAAAANTAAAQHEERAAHLAAQLAHVTAEVEKVSTELEKARRGGDTRVAQIANDIARGVDVTPEAVVDRFGGSRRTAQRLIKDARELAEERPEDDRLRPLAVVRGQ